MIYTPEQFIEKMTAKIAALDSAKLIYPAATEVHDMLVTRVFDEGKGGDNAQIGNYSTEPAYYTKKQFNGSGFKPQGKTEKGSKKKNGTDRMSMYLPGGYKELRQIQGYETAFVNLTYSAKLRKEFATKLAIEGDSVVLRLRDKLNKDKVDGLTEKYGSETFKHTTEERKFFAKEVTAATIKYLSN